MGLNTNLLEQLSFYGAYHHNRWNQLIHFIFVPSILWSIMVWLAYTGPVLPDLPEMYKPPPPLARYEHLLRASRCPMDFPACIGLSARS
jgi:hypothetical protein